MSLDSGADFFVKAFIGLPNSSDTFYIALHTSPICPIELKMDFLEHILTYLRENLVHLRNTMSFDWVHR